MENTPPIHFTETQEKFSHRLLVAVEQKLEKIEFDGPILATSESEDPENYLLLHKYARNAYRLTLSLQDVKNTDNANERISKFDSLMTQLAEATEKVGKKPFVYNQIPNEGALHQKRGYTSWEFLGLEEQPFNTETTNQATVLEISEMIAKKIGVDLDL